MRSTFRFNARMTPMRANIVGPPDSATNSGVLQGEKLLPLRQLNRIIEGPRPAHFPALKSARMSSIIRIPAR
jgi:hypothetical protein